MSDKKYLESLTATFNRVLQVTFAPSEKLYDDSISFIQNNVMCDITDQHVKKIVLYYINRKFELNKKNIKNLIDKFASCGVIFGYFEKEIISYAFDMRDLSFILEHIKFTDNQKLILYELFIPVSEVKTIGIIAAELQLATPTRKDSISKSRKTEILSSIFSSTVYALGNDYELYFSKKENIKRYFSKLNNTCNDEASCNLLIVDLNTKSSIFDSKYAIFRNNIFSLINEAYKYTKNFGHLSILIRSDIYNKWELCEDIKFYSERFLDVKIKNAYFKKEAIETQTLDYIESLSCKKASFETVNWGFFYKDTFYIKQEDAILIIFQKKEQDEQVIPCPACYSTDVQGNSYSSLGVKSWECNNRICPERSKFNRGKRYSLYQLNLHKMLLDESNSIPRSMIKTWSRDVIEGLNLKDTFEMILKFYTSCKETVFIVNGERIDASFGRKIKNIQIKFEDKKYQFPPKFIDKYCIKKDTKASSYFKTSTFAHATLINGDAFSVLNSIQSEFFDGAVTSPPYYNAREYSNWHNIYCYLYDMFNIALATYRVLKRGAVYLYNIFDYFDNENNIVFSAMGKRRLCLSSYTVDIFRRAGFNFVGNIVWDKGEIEGNRAYNNGNTYPLYQAPFNCWEHVLVFQKPGEKYYDIDFSNYVKVRPVFKMVRGVNIHGHSAPFPEEIPNILLERLSKNHHILDPFGGSMTTSVAGNKKQIATTCIEISEQYFDLAQKKLMI